MHNTGLSDELLARIRALGEARPHTSHKIKRKGGPHAGEIETNE